VRRKKRLGKRQKARSKKIGQRAAAAAEGQCLEADEVRIRRAE